MRTCDIPKLPEKELSILKRNNKIQKKALNEIKKHLENCDIIDSSKEIKILKEKNKTQRDALIAITKIIDNYIKHTPFSEKCIILLDKINKISLEATYVK